MSDKNEDAKVLFMQTEKDILNGIVACSKDRENENNWKKETIYAPDGTERFSFRIHAVTEEEIEACRKASTKMIRNPLGKRLPKVEGDTNWIKMRSLKIYNATVEDDQKLIWDNTKIQEAVGVVGPVALIDLILTAGRKEEIINDIDDISGLNGATTDENDDEDINTLKNS